MGVTYGGSNKNSGNTEWGQMIEFSTERKVGTEEQTRGVKAKRASQGRVLKSTGAGLRSQLAESPPRFGVLTNSPRVGASVW